MPTVIHLVVPLALTVAVLVLYTGYLTWRLHKTDERLSDVARSRYAEIESVSRFATATAHIVGIPDDVMALQIKTDSEDESKKCPCDGCARWRKDHGVPEPECDAETAS